MSRNYIIINILDIGCPYIMTNQEIAKILFEIAEYLAMDDVPFKPRICANKLSTPLTIDRYIIYDIY